MAHDVFISYSSKDKPTADAVCATLEANAIRCWIAPRDVLPGMEWGGAIVDAIHNSQIMVMVFSSRANDSKHIKREVERAVNRGVCWVLFRDSVLVPLSGVVGGHPAALARSSLPDRGERSNDAVSP